MAKGPFQSVMLPCATYIGLYQRLMPLAWPMPYAKGTCPMLWACQHWQCLMPKAQRAYGMGIRLMQCLTQYAIHKGMCICLWQWLWPYAYGNATAIGLVQRPMPHMHSVGQCLLHRPHGL